MSTTNDMKRKARAVLEERPLPIPTAEPAPMSPELREALAGITDQLARQRVETAALRAAVDTLTERQEMTPPAAEACREAAARMTRAAERVSAGASLLQEIGRSFREAVTEVLEHREGRGRRMAAALLLACALPGVLGNIWLAWRAGLI